LTGLALSLALAGSVAVATPASAATQFWAYTTNYDAYASLYYQYDQHDSAGYYHISVTDASVKDTGPCGDGWGGVLRMYYTNRYDEVQETLAYAQDCSSKSARDQDKTGYKDVWFEVCNWNTTTGEAYTCVRLHK
jgi:hypothetical protein